MSGTRQLWLPVGLAMTFALHGCGQDTAEPLPTVALISVPDDFQMSNKKWALQEQMETADTVCLARFFQNNKEFAGSPELEGKPVLFRSGKKDRLFFWLQPAIDEDRWRCVCYENGKYDMKDGTGSPFIEG